MSHRRLRILSIMKYRVPALLLLLTACGLSARAQWGTLLDPSRAINWTGTGFTIPSFSTNCATQPALKTGSGNASANTTAIQNALNSCDATHNVVNLTAGTYYVNGWKTDGYNNTVVRGA